MAGEGAKPLVGVQGKQYGLIIKNRAPAPTLKKVFNVDEDDTTSAPVNTQLALQQSQKTKKEFEELHKKALHEDPTVFAYDEVVDAIQGDRENKQIQKHQEQAKRQPKYIHQLLERAKIKQLEDDLVYDRQLAKERAVDEHLYGGKEKFMTSAYKEKLVVQEKFKADLALKAAEEEKNAVEKRGNMAGFFSNLLTKNENMGGGPRDFAGKKPQEAASTPAAAVAPSATAAPGGGLDNVTVKQEPKDDSSENERRRDDDRSSERKRSRESDKDRRPRHGHDREDTVKREGGVKEEPSDEHRRREYSPGGTEIPWKRIKYEYAEKKVQLAPKQLPKLDEKEVAAARERYLKRKAEREAAAHAA